MIEALIIACHHNECLKGKCKNVNIVDPEDAVRKEMFEKILKNLSWDIIVEFSHNKFLFYA